MHSTDQGPNTGTDLMRVLVVERDAGWRDALVEAFLARGLAVTPVDSIDEASWWIDSDSVDLVVTDLASATSSDTQLMRAVRKRRTVVPVVVTITVHDEKTVSSLRNGTTDVLLHPFEEQEVDRVIERALAMRLRHTDALRVLPFTRERIEIAIPSRVEFLDGILNHLTDCMIKMGVVQAPNTNVLIALDEAIVNAIKHGNKYDESKQVNIVAEVSCHEARFTITDEGPGFSIQDVPDPCAPENLLRTSGRGLLLIRNIMDEMSYNERGNAITMVKKAESDSSLECTPPAESAQDNQH